MAKAVRRDILKVLERIDLHETHCMSILQNGHQDCDCQGPAVLVVAMKEIEMLRQKDHDLTEALDVPAKSFMERRRRKSDEGR